MCPFPHDWLTWKLTGAFVTDRGDASGTGYFSAAHDEYRLGPLAIVDDTVDWALQPSAGALPDHAARPGAGVRAAELAGGAAVPRRDGLCCELRLGEPRGAGASGAPVGGAGPRAAGRGRHAPVYDVAHNVAKLEVHDGRELCVHRKGATRAFPAGSLEIPPAFRKVGQPVFIPGSMGTSSFVLVGREGAMERSFGTTCHGAGGG